MVCFYQFQSHLKENVHYFIILCLRAICIFQKETWLSIIQIVGLGLQKQNSKLVIAFGTTPSVSMDFFQKQLVLDFTLHLFFFSAAHLQSKNFRALNIHYLSFPTSNTQVRMQQAYEEQLTIPGLPWLTFRVPPSCSLNQSSIFSSLSLYKMPFLPGSGSVWSILLFPHSSEDIVLVTNEKLFVSFFLFPDTT